MNITEESIRAEVDIARARLLLLNDTVNQLRAISKKDFDKEFGEIIKSVERTQDKYKYKKHWLASSKDIYMHKQLFKGALMEGKTKHEAKIRLIACLICFQGMHNSLQYGVKL